MRTSISAMGSVMLISGIPVVESFQHRYRTRLPTGLAQTGDIATHGCLAQLVAAQAELGVKTTRATGGLAAVALTRGAGIARRVLQTCDKVEALFVRGVRAGTQCLVRIGRAACRERECWC